LSPEREEQEAEEEKIAYKPDYRTDRADKINVTGCLSRGEGCEEVTMQFMVEGRR